MKTISRPLAVFLAIGLAFSPAIAAQAGVITVSATAPTIDGADIANLANPGPGAGAFDPGGNEGHIWSNRPIQGQTFTTGSSAGGYTLSSVTLQDEENNINNNSSPFTVRIGSISGNTFTQIASEDSTNTISYVTNDFMTFNFATSVNLSPNTVYGFEWDASGSGFTTWNNADTNYAGGTGYSSGGGGVPDDTNLVWRNIDRVFHVDMVVAALPGLPLFWPGGAGFWTNDIWLDDVLGTGTNQFTHPQNIAGVVNPANITEGFVIVSFNEEAYSLTMDTGTNGSGGRPGNGQLVVEFGNTLSINTDATISNTSQVHIGLAATLDVVGTLTIGPTATFDNRGTANAGTLAGTGTATLNAASKLKAGGGTLGAITLTGNAEVEIGGTVTIGQLNLPASTTITKSGTGTLDVTGATTLLAGQIYNPTAGTLRYSGAVGGSADLVKNGAGTLHLTQNNSYTGQTTVNGGILHITNGGALGDTGADTVVNNGGQLRLGGSGNITTPGGEAISINGNANGGAIYSQGNNNEIDGPVSLAGNAEIRVNANRLRLDGGVNLSNRTLTLDIDGGDSLEIRQNAITGSGTISQVDDGTLNIRINSPAYTGQINITNGVLDLDNRPTGLGSIAGSTNIDGDATLRLRGNVTTAEPITLNGTANSGNGQNEGRIRNDANNNTLSGTIGWNTNSRVDVDGGTSLTLSGVISGGGAMNKVDSGRLILSNGGNTFTGAVNVTGGTVEAAHLDALGATSGVNVSGGGALDLSAAGTYTIVPLNISGAGVGGTGALVSSATDKQIDSAIDVVGTTIGNSTAATTFTINGPINLPSSGDLTFTGPGDIVVVQPFGNGGAPVSFDGLTAMRFNTNTPASDLDFGAVGAYTVNPDGTVSQASRLLALTPNIVALQDIALNMDRNGAAAPGPGNGPFQWQAVFGSSVSGDRNNFEVAWTGEFSPDANGDFTFRSHDKNFTGGNVDDDASIFIDANEDGIFQASEGFFSASGAAVTVTGLDATKKYRVAIGFHEGGGDEEVSYTFQGTAGAFTSETGIIPGAAAQSGLFTTTITPDNSVTKAGAGTTTFMGANTYNGTTTIDEGTLIAANSAALGFTDGTAASGTSVADGATLALQGNIAVGDEHLTLGGAGATVRNLSGSNSMATQTVVVGSSSLATDQVKIQSDSGSLTLGTSGDFDLNYSQLNVDGPGNTTITQKISAQGIGTTVGSSQNALDAFAFNVSGSNGDNNLDEIGQGGGLLTQTPISRILIDGTDRIDYRNDNDFRNGDAGLQAQGFAVSLDGLAGLNQNDNYATMFTGQVNIPDLNSGLPYNVEFGTNRSDDPMQVYVDLDQDGIFEAPVGDAEGEVPGVNERVVSRNCCGNRFNTISIGPGTYDYMAVHLERGGGSQVEPMIDLTPDALGRRTVQPGQMGGLFTISDILQAPTQYHLIKDGAGTLRLTGDNDYDGETLVAAGTLLIDGTTSGQGTYTVQSGATLGGTGTIGLAAGESVTFEGGSFLAPGTSVGTLTVDVDGNVTMEAGSTYLWELGPDENDVVSVVTVTLTLEDWTLQLIDAGGEPLAGETYYLFTGFSALELAGGSDPANFNAFIDTSLVPDWDTSGLSIGRDAQGLFLQAAAIPEPSTLVLLVLGGLGLLACVWRRRRRA